MSAEDDAEEEYPPVAIIAESVEPNKELDAVWLLAAERRLLVEDLRDAGFTGMPLPPLLLL